MPFGSNLSDTDKWEWAKGQNKGHQPGRVRREPMVFFFLILEHLEKLPACVDYGISAPLRARSGSRKAKILKIVMKKEINWKNIMYLKAVCSFFRSGWISWRLKILHGDPR
jgi:hypothetical protein